MIIVTPSPGSVPEPRPQALVTGDRAVVLVSDNGVTVSALIKAGVQIVTVSKSVYDEITSQLAQTTSDVDPATGTIKEALLPARLSPAAITALNLLNNGTIQEQYLPARLSPANLTALMSSSGGTSSSSAAITTATIATANITTATVTGSLTSPSVVVTGAVESASHTLDNQSTAPAAPAAGKVSLFTDVNGRLTLKNSSSQLYLVGNKRIVTSWPASADSQLGDEAILAATGEHRIYKGSTLGWRLASPHVVTSLAARNAITNPYNGMRVYCDFGRAQEHTYDAGVWRGTKGYAVSGGVVRYNGGVNDTNFRRWNETPINDPGFPYFVFGRLSMEIVQLGPKSRSEVWVGLCDQVTGANYQAIDQAFWDGWSPEDPHGPQATRFEMSPLTPEWAPQTGNRQVNVDWRCTTNGANAYSGAYMAWTDYMVFPA